MKHYEFRRQVAVQLCESKTEITEPENTIPYVIIEEPVPVCCNDLGKHQISQASGSVAKRFRPTCYACMMYKHENPSDAKYPRVVYFCRECKLAFHPMCVTAYHNPKSLNDDNLKSFMKSIHPPERKNSC